MRPSVLFRVTRSRFIHSMAPVLPPDRRPLVISGPSGAGKGTLFTLLFQRHPDTFTFSVSHTTRGPRDGEQHGVNYHFVTRDAFEDLKARDGFVESATFGGNMYGTSKATIEEQSAKGKVVVLDIEMEGVKQIKAIGFPARFVFIAPPSEEELERRLRGRGTDSEASILKRLAQAKVELEYSTTPGVHDKIIVNEDVETAYRELEEFVFSPAEQS
ncbi:guanylate kinase [Lasiosphaeria miniovina]|uniref:Guanylate kinase n=1 Tax=Lasiosphaeria miniovina TaxID=1954250 RepID=A0AA40ATL4_9PEZI|nr:guanylate kinase [Lasiosphaeria miniovina]KAK0721677.1 guanylate kinase [Lasiosphaeria miniovina]